MTEDRDNLSELPQSWELTSLRNLFCWSNGKNLTKQKMEGGSYCVYGGNGIAGHHNQWLCEEQSIIVGRVGAQCGNVHLAPSHSWITDNAIYTSWKTNHIYLRFFYYLLGNFKLNELAGGSGQPYISQTILNPLLIPVPPLNEQHRIVAKIEALKARSQRVKEELEAIPALLDQFRQSVLAAAFRGDLTADWREKNPDVEPASVLLERIRAERRRRWEEAELEKMKAQGKTPKDDKWKEKYKEPESLDSEELLEIPTNWSWARVDEVGKVQLGRQRAPQHHSGDYMRPYLRAANVFEDRIDTSDILEMNFNLQEYETYRLKFGDILLNEGQSKELVGRPAIYRGEVPGSCFQNTLVRFQAYDGVIPEYALIVFRGYMHTGRFQRIAQWTTNIAHLGAGRFAAIEFPLPPKDEQIEIVSRVKDKLAGIKKIEDAYKTVIGYLEKLNQSILAKAFRGELVPQDPNDEPASVLLERIRAEREKLDTKKKAKGKTEKKSRKAKPEAAELEQLNLPGFE